MRGILFSVLFGLAGAAASVLIVWLAASAWSSFSGNWFTAAALLPIFGVCAGPALAARLRPGEDPWPIEGRARRLPYALVAVLASGLACYLAFVVTAMTWFAATLPDAGFFHLVFNPSALPSLSQTKGASTTEVTVWLQAAIGAGVGGVATFFWVGKKWT